MLLFCTDAIERRVDPRIKLLQTHEVKVYFQLLQEHLAILLIRNWRLLIKFIFLQSLWLFGCTFLHLFLYNWLRRFLLLFWLLNLQPLLQTIVHHLVNAVEIQSLVLFTKFVNTLVESFVEVF